MAFEASCYRPECAGMVCLTDDQEREFRRSHESFFCTAGHSQHFAGESDHEREVRLLTARIEQLLQLVQDYRDASRRCPWPTCRSRRLPHVYASRNALIEHMQRAHGMPAMSVVRAEQEAS